MIDAALRVPFVDLAAQHAPLRADLVAAFERVLASGRFVLGAEVAELEAAVAGLCGCAHAIGVSSGTDALLACLMAEGIGPGDEVVVPDYSFVATASVVARVGATPVFVDVEPQSFGLDPSRLAAAITPRTRAIVPVHLFGQACDLDPILAVARAAGVLVVEDAAQAIGAIYRGRPVGSFGDYGAFSFFPTKNLGAVGDGGLVVTGDAERAARVRALRSHGASARHRHDVVGGNFRLDELQAALLRVKLPHLASCVDARRRNAARYAAALAGHARLELPEALPGRSHVYNQFVVRCEDRDRVRAQLRDRGVGTEIYYPVPLHRQPCFRASVLREPHCPVAERLAATSIALPIGAEVTADAVGHVVRSLEEVLG